jgi:hypothetical protein
LTDTLASLAAAALWWFTSVARATVTLGARFDRLLNVVVELVIVEAVMDGLPVRVQPSFDHVVGEILQDLARNVGNVKGKHYRHISTTARRVAIYEAHGSKELEGM